MMSIRTMVPCSKFVYDFRMTPAIKRNLKISNRNGPCDCAPKLDYAGQMIPRDAKIFLSLDTGEASGTKATKEKGERRWEVMIPNSLRFVGSLINTLFEDLYKKRY